MLISISHSPEDPGLGLMVLPLNTSYIIRIIGGHPLELLVETCDIAVAKNPIFVNGFVPGLKFRLLRSFFNRVCLE